LAVPSGLGDQAPLIAEGFDAVAISSGGERPLDSSDDQLDDLSGSTIDAFGRSVQSAVGALDFATSEPVHGPRTYVRLGSNLVPGWALSTLALALLLPAAAAAVDVCARALRRGLEAAPALVWALACSLPFVGAVAVLYGLALVGLVPRPPFPFDPGVVGLGARGAITFAAMLIVAVASAFVLHRRNITAAAAPTAALAACGAIGVAACLAIWLANPYLALFLAPTAHVWLLAGRSGRGVRIGTVAGAVLALLPVAAAFAAVAAALDLGPGAPWTFTIMVADGQIGLLPVIGGCLLAGALAGAAILAGRPVAESRSAATLI
jgi:hypothetical protein